MILIISFLFCIGVAVFSLFTGIGGVFVLFPSIIVGGIILGLILPRLQVIIYRSKLAKKYREWINR